MLNKKLLFFVTLLTSLLIASCSSSPKQPNIPHSDIVIKYSVRSFEMDLTQTSYKVGQGFPERAELESLLKADFIRKLEADDLLATENDINVVDLDIFVDYRRRFVGDATPIPMNTLAPPDVRVTEKTLLGNITLRHDKSGHLTNKKLVFSTDQEQSKGQELVNIFAISNTLIIRLKNRRQTDANLFAQQVNGLSPDAIRSKREFTEKAAMLPPVLAGRTGLVSADYIPSEVIDGYVKILTGSNSKQRLDTYSQITTTWINNTALYDVIADNIKQNYSSTDKNIVKETIQATKALAFSGLSHYESVIEQISKDAASEELKNYAVKALAILSERAELAVIVHNTEVMNPELDWQSNQLANMLMSDSLQLRSFAIKEIYRTQLHNTELLDVVSYQLDTEATVQRYRINTWQYNDFYAWSCRVLGSSKNVKYKPVLEKVATHTEVSKVRDYAKKFAKQLK